MATARRIKLPKLAGGSARKVSTTSSSLQATGAAKPPAIDQEIGSGRPVSIQEIVPDLASSFQRLQTYKKMMNDAAVDVSVRAAKTPILGADFFVEPFSADQEDRDIAEFIGENLFGGMSAPFLNALEDILHMFEDGYSVLEKVPENRTWAPKRTGANGKTYTMLKKLAVRPASTIKDIEYDNNGGPVKITQSAIQADQQVVEKDIDISKLLIFTFSRTGSDLTGKSILRTAYPHWYYKTHLYKIDAIQKERHALGVPKGKLLPGYTNKDKEILRNLLANLRANEESFMVLPPNVEVEFAELHGQLVNVLDSAEHHNTMILMNVMAQFLALGLEGNGGGRATGGTQTDIYMKALRYVANYIVDVINMYLIPELVVWNFPTNRFPKLQVRNIGETRDLQMLGSGISNLFSQNALSPSLATENWIRKVFDMPEITQEEFDAAQAAAVEGSAQKGGVKKSNGQPGKPVNAPQ